MNRRVLMRVAAAMSGLMVSATVVHTAELRVFTSIALKQALNELSPIFSRRRVISSPSAMIWRRSRRSASSTASAPM